LISSLFYNQWSIFYAGLDGEEVWLSDDENAQRHNDFDVIYLDDLIAGCCKILHYFEAHSSSKQELFSTV